MTIRPPFVVLLLVALVGSCKKSSGDGDGEGSAAEKAAQVERICSGMNDLSLAYVAGVMEIEVDELDAAARATLRMSCKALPLDVARCADRLAIGDAKCDAALEAFLGMTDTTPQGDGPAPSWMLTPPFEVYDLAVGSQGRVAIVSDGGVGMVEGGELRWSEELEDGSARVAWWTDHVVTGAGGTLTVYDASGGAAWSKTLGDDGTWLSAIEAGPDGAITVVTDAGAIVRFDGTTCATDAAAEGCATTVGTVEALGGKMIEVLEGGALLASGDSGIALVSAGGELLAERPADYDAGAPRDGLVVVGKDLIAADPSCEAGSESCFEVLASAKDMELVAPLRRDGSLVYADTYGVIVSTGAHEWKIDAGNDSDLLGDGRAIYSVGHELGLDSMDAPPQVRAIDPESGKTRWITALGTERASLLTGPLAELREGVLVVSTKKQLFAVPVDKAR